MGAAMGGGMPGGGRPGGGMPGGGMQRLSHVVQTTDNTFTMAPILY
jgi:hypothetical protein